MAPLLCRMMRSIVLLQLLIVISSIESSKVVTATMNLRNETDKVSLLVFKQGISNDPLGVLSSWNDSSSDFCKWQGVVCGRRHQRVVALELAGSSLVGWISPSIGNLSFLHSINLQNNSFHGRIPKEISKLSRLRSLVLSNNSLGGDIPSNLSHCFLLNELYLSYNSLTGKIPTELGTLSKLVTLTFFNNNLTGGIPPSLGNLSNLEKMNVAFNKLEGNIPHTVAQLTSLNFLSFTGNKFSGMLPSMIYNMSSLFYLYTALNRFHGNLPPDMGLTLPNIRYLVLGGNQFFGAIPRSLSNASRLQVLDISRSNFEGQVPTSLGSLENLKWLNLGENHLGSKKPNDLNFITSLTNCTKLETLGLNDNLFGGVLPNSISNLTNHLNTLVLGRNKIHGNIPESIENLINLNELGLEENLFTGSIPTSLGKLKNLKELFLYENRFVGRIPYSLGNITRLWLLDLAKNYLEGNIPSALGQCTDLQTLDLSENNLSGTIPKEVLLGLSSLSIVLDVSSNSLTGPLPIEVGALKNLGHLDASHNKLSGKIPVTLGSCMSLEQLYLEDNSFVGEIPMALSNLKAISVLDLSKNNLSGPIPKYLESFPFLVTLNLSFNDLEGEVPKGVFKNSSVVAVAGNTKLCGGILELHLPRCNIEHSAERGRRLHRKVVVAIILSAVGCLIAVSSILIFCWIKRKKKLPTAPSTDQFGKIKLSYEALFKATDGFSSANLIGSGSFGSVYKGSLDQDGTVVAIKVFNHQQRGESKTFKAECEALRNIRHRNLVKIVTSCSSIDSKGNDFKALVFEFMQNGSLEQWLHPSLEEDIQPRKLSLIQRLNILIDVASALDYLHHHCHRTVVHCDLKPSNVLLDADMTAHVGDFGLARLSLQTHSLSAQQSSSIGIKGSIGYSAPEYGVGSTASTRGDVYSFGIVLLEMMIGKRPTDEMFTDGLNLHIFAKTAFPERVMQTMDHNLLVVIEEIVGEGTSRHARHNHRMSKMQECIMRLVRIGIECSLEHPKERMNMKDVVGELHLIRNTLLDVETDGPAST
ncbi:hypothetical protein Sjap_001013 [Stephania japonica]|uniref:non-specific serine/threonine protein kinase n=1 Tax=Stephania japonica TaxID=461633 RepID=A0AAP0PR22_9MAGN